MTVTQIYYIVLFIVLVIGLAIAFGFWLDMGRKDK